MERSLTRMLLEEDFHMDAVLHLEDFIREVVNDHLGIQAHKPCGHPKTAWCACTKVVPAIDLDRLYESERDPECPPSSIYGDETPPAY